MEELLKEIIFLKNCFMQATLSMLYVDIVESKLPKIYNDIISLRSKTLYKITSERALTFLDGFCWAPLTQNYVFVKDHVKLKWAESA